MKQPSIDTPQGASAGTGKATARAQLSIRWRRHGLIVLFASVCLFAHAGAALAVQVSGTITDHGTGAPIQGVEITADLMSVGEGELTGLTVGHPVGRAETNSAGRYEVQVPSGMYSIWAEAPGYFTQGLGAPTGNNASPELEVGASGLVGLDASMVPDTSPYIGLFPTIMRWSHEPKQSFRSMVLLLEYGGFAAIPSGWPYQHLISHVTDSGGKPIWPSFLTIDDLVPPGGEGEGGTNNPIGSADGCSFFGSSKRQPDVHHLKVVSYLESDPSLRAEEAITPDFSECTVTKLTVIRPSPFHRRQLDLSAQLVDRLPSDDPVPGTMRFIVDGGRPVTVHVKDATGTVSKVVRRHTHPGRNRVVVYFEPSVSTVTPPPAKHLTFRIPRPHRHHRR